MIPRVTLPIIPISANFLITTHWTRKLVWMQILFRFKMFQTNNWTALDRFTSGTYLSGGGLYRPVTVNVLLYLCTGHWLLSAPCAIFYIVRMKPHSIIRIKQLHNGAAGDVSLAGPFWITTNQMMPQLNVRIINENYGDLPWVCAKIWKKYRSSDANNLVFIVSISFDVIEVQKTRNPNLTTKS